MVQASYTIVCKPQPLRHDISRRGSQINPPFFHLVHFFQLYNILKNQNRAFLPLDPPSGLNLKLHPLNLHPITSNYIQSTSTSAPQPQPPPINPKLHPLNLKLHPLNLYPFNLELHPSTSAPSTSTTTS